ncbi:hypothetical protein ABN36_18330 [Salmonella enterica subsp. enterica]|uniref:hypothetical protein n=1 Tax=Salmonella enterica TaxID=28901 RepID=UPI0009AF82A0|nr:hypothetical protein [Salmonella enterica]EBZ0015933.1 hypothetical protein [Salmonella enterica subsp. enterica serovar Suberu]ECH9540620.1 hypothetical protein [Salmonella enterica subsp. enterica]ECM8230959.1 hypothetical protein [Salmonella enterica subsp. enterica serovar Kentucky]EGI6509436.1 hypothetical protein [Salmonella enterica subsp. enterica serovar Durham]EDW9825737.1 hypothetical protein [Salmonella enterica]
MSIIQRKRDRKKDGTRFYHAETNKPLCRLDVTLSQYDWEQLQVLFSFIYNQGKAAGSAERAAEIRQALGLGEE